MTNNDQIPMVAKNVALRRSRIQKDRKNADKLSIFYPSNDKTPMIVTNHSPTGFWQWSPLCQKPKVCVLGLLENVEVRFFLSFTEISRARKPIRNHQISDEDIPTVHFVTGKMQIPTQQICSRVIQLIHVEEQDTGLFKQKQIVPHKRNMWIPKLMVHCEICPGPG